MIKKKVLQRLYTKDRKSAKEIAEKIGHSESKVRYWLRKHEIPTRSISEAIYSKHNPDGDPFELSFPQNINNAILFGVGLGLYWGEGTKTNKHSIRLGNTDPRLIANFIHFVTTFLNFKKEKMQFGLQIFSDIDPDEALEFWARELNVDKSQFYKPTVSISVSQGTYKKKAKYGVLTVLCNNMKMRQLVGELLEQVASGKTFS